MKAALLVLALASSPSVLAHHSVAAIYAVDKTAKVEGIVTRFSLGNPHMRIYFTRTDQKDRTTEWVAEGGSRTVLSRRGWTADLLKPGDRVVLVANPAHDGRTFVHITEITLADGRTLAAEDLLPTAPALRRPAGAQEPGTAGK